MIESETTLTMRCDLCDRALVDDSGQIATTIVNHYFEHRAYNDLYKIANENGWLCDPKGCICPDCLKECADEIP